ncbi:MAG: hypothetical protein EXQ70_11240 [Solirubrobacterales bacterium]|nr:hypothetical protein [Solirubrobacterales bacterium]
MLGIAPARNPAAKDLLREIAVKHPRVRDAVPADARLTAQHRGERHSFHSRLDTAIQILRLIWVTDAFLAQVIYRVRGRLRARGVPLLPQLCHRLSMLLAQVSIGEPVLIHPGLYLFHGQTVIDGLTEIHSGALIAPWTTIGLVEGDLHGPTIGPGVRLGTSSAVLGPLNVGAGSRIGANSLVLDDVPEGATVVGSPARVLEASSV